MYNIAEGGDGIDPKLASQLAKERWSKVSKEDRIKHMSNARKAYFEKYPRGIVDVMKNHICPECGSQGHSHKKGCSKYIPLKTYTCEVCGRAIKNKGNLTQHMAAHERRGEC